MVTKLLNWRKRRRKNTPKPGLFVFRRSVLGWIFDPALRQQLPFVYQIFSLYCYGYCKLTRQSRIYGGQRLFYLLAWLYASFAPQRYLKLCLHRYIVFLDPLDTRFLGVVYELTNPSSHVHGLSRFLTAGDTFIDIGANHGSFAIVASKLVGAQGCVIAIEPQPRLAKVVEQSLSANALGKFQVQPIAVCDFEGEVALLIPRHSSGMAGIYPAFSGGEEHTRVQVPIRRLDDCCAWRDLPGRILIKLDVEGSEYAVLVGAQKLIAARKPNLLFEINPKSLQAAGITEEKMKRLLSDLGYNRYAECIDLERSLPITDLQMKTHRNIVFLNC